MSFKARSSFHEKCIEFDKFFTQCLSLKLDERMSCTSYLCDVVHKLAFLTGVPCIEMGGTCSFRLLPFVSIDQGLDILVVLTGMRVLVLFCDTPVVPASDTRCRFGGRPDESATDI